MSAFNPMDWVKSKIQNPGQVYAEAELEKFLRGIVLEKIYPEQMACFLTLCRVMGLTAQEVISWTRAMVNVGERLNWGHLGVEKIMDKHCVGGVPGNRVTPLVVSIVAANGLIIPKTSSRAITSPAGTADVMEVLTKVDLSLSEMRRVVDQEGGCFVWGGGTMIAPADPYLIQVEKKLGLGLLGQIVASILAKKIAAGSTHVLIDIPVGPEIKIHSELETKSLSDLLMTVGGELGLKLRILQSEGSQPIGCGIGPALEARDVLYLLENKKTENQQALSGLLKLKNKALKLAGEILEMGGVASLGSGFERAEKTLETGRALEKFKNICEAQGEFKQPKYAKFSHTVLAHEAQLISELSCRFFAELAKLAGAPMDKEAGVDLHVQVDEWVEKNQPIFTIYSNSQAQLQQALEFAGVKA